MEKLLPWLTWLYKSPRGDPECGKLVDYFPIFIHILDIDTYVEPIADPLDNIINGYMAETSVMVQQRIPAFIKEVIEEKRLIIFLDGLDEIPSAEIQKAQIFIDALFKNIQKSIWFSQLLPIFWMDSLILTLFQWD